MCATVLLLAGFASFSAGAGVARPRAKSHHQPRPRLVGGRMTGSSPSGSATRVRLRFSQRVSFHGTRHGSRLVSLSGYQIGRIYSARNTSWITVQVKLRKGRSASARERLRLFSPRRGPSIHDKAGDRPRARSIWLSDPRAASAEAASNNGPWYTLNDPINPDEQTDIPFGDRSQWDQPWRAYLDTEPASMMRNAVGINFNVSGSQANATAQLLAQSGFTHARLEIGWSSMSYANPSQFVNQASVDQQLQALKQNGIRPLILLNADDLGPCPLLKFTANVLQSAPAGATEVQVDQATASQLVPGYSGLNGPTGIAAQYIVTSVGSNGWVQLSQPLSAAIPAGNYPGSTLRYQPFAPPETSTGAPNPVFQATLSGWLQYVAAVTSEVKRVLGNDNFDVEVWNELTLDPNFLSIANYYNPVPASLQGTGSVDDQILDSTVSWIRNPANDLPGVGIGDGFANQTPFVSGTTVPAGVTAIDKHPYNENYYQYPQDELVDNSIPLNALGGIDGSENAAGNWTSYAPSYDAFFPEYVLTAIKTEYLERDISPITTSIYGTPHGRYTEPAGTTTPPQLWVTETNINLATAPPGMTSADLWHLQAKATLRTLASFVNLGVSTIDFYAVNNNLWSMVEPGAPGGGPTMTAVKSFLSFFNGPSSIGTPRSLSLNAISDQDNAVQFEGDGTAAHPPLYNRDVVGFFPFQVSNNKFVIPTYVMTRDMAKNYNPSAPSSDLARYDLPPEAFRLTVGGINAADLTATATDPITGASVPVSIVSRSGNTAVIQLNLTDYPRMLVLQDG